MVQKLIGAGCVFVACGAAGFGVAASVKKEEKLLLQTKRLLEKMESELSCRVTSLPELCLCVVGCGSELEQLYGDVSRLLQLKQFPDASCCMEQGLRLQKYLPKSVAKIHRMLGETMGRYDLPGQLDELSAVKEACLDELNSLRQNMSQKVRSYRTLGLCAGAALAILLM